MLVPINIYYSDGRFEMRRVDSERYIGWPVHTYISLNNWNEYEKHMQEDYVWQEYIGKLNREKE